MKQVIRSCVLMAALVVAQPAAAQPVKIPLPRPTTVQEPFIEVDVDPIPPIELAETKLVADGARAHAVWMERVPVPVAIALVVNTSAPWFTAGEGRALVNGILRGVPWQEAGPAGSSLSIIGYDRGARELLAATPLTELPAKLAEAGGETRRELGAGLALAVETLSRTTVPRRLVIVVGDGVDDGDAKQLAAAAYRAHDGVVRVVALSTEKHPQIEEVLLPARLVALTSVEAGVAAIRAEFAQQVARTRVRFDASALSWDGGWHRLHFSGNGVHLHFIETRLPATHRRSAVHWSLAALAIAMLLLVAVATRPRARS